MLARRTLAFLLIFGLALAILPIASYTRTADAAGASIYWGAYIDGQAYGYNDPPYDTRAIDAFEAHAGKKMSIFHWGQSWMNNDGSWAAFPTSYFNTVRGRGSIPMLTWQSVRAGYGTTQADFQSNDVTSGKYDSYITNWANAAKAWGKPFFLRFDHEMNGYWYAYGEGKTSAGAIINGNQTGDYVKMWRHVHDIFTSVGATNATWVWCPNIEGNNTQFPALSTLYPGDSYVDWSCIDGYNKPTGWLSSNQVFSASGISWLRNSYQNVLNLAPNKPMMIGETASYEAGDGGVKKAAWITDLLATQIPLNFPKVKAIVWFNWDESSSWTFRIETSQAAQNAFATAIGSANYAANSFGSITTSPIPALGATATASPTSATLAPVADTFIDSRYPTSASGGTSASVFSSGSPGRKSFLKFDLSSLAGKTISSIKLRVHTTNNTSSNSVDAHSVNLVGDTSWTEAGVTYNTAPAVTTTVLGSIPANTAVNTWYDITLSAAAVQPKAGGLLALAVQSSGSDGLQFDARESTSKPQLVITYS